MIRAAVLALGLALGPGAGPAPAVQPDEVLADPEQEARAREISKELRCLVCRNEAIDDSNAELARILRLLVRERVTAGDSDAEVIDYVVDRYGEYVLLRPRFTPANALIWLSGPLILGLGGWVAWRFVRGRSVAAAAGPAPLSADERARLDALLRDG